jgi:hypothetical protein
MTSETSIFRNGKRKRDRGLRKNKRGEDMLVDFWAILVFAVIIVLFVILFSASKKKITENINTEFESKDAGYMLDAFLRAPLVNDPSKTVSDIIAEDTAMNNFDRTDALCKEYFKYTTLINGEEIFEMNINIKGSNHKSLQPISLTKNGNGEALTAKTYIPGYDSRISVELEIWSIYDSHQ